MINEDSTNRTHASAPGEKLSSATDAAGKEVPQMVTAPKAANPGEKNLKGILPRKVGANDGD